MACYFSSLENLGGHECRVALHINSTTYHSSVRIRMTRASALNGDGLYAIKSFNVYFDTNLAHFKPITAPVLHLNIFEMGLDVMLFFVKGFDF